MELSVAEGRVLGCLIEKQVAESDDAYALTLDELRFSCNQTSGRDPVVAFDDRTVEDTLLSLKAMGLARFVTVGHRAGPLTYRHRADERWRLARPELMVLATLLLRGPQTVEQIWKLLENRVEGQSVVGSPTDIEVALDTLAGRTPTPLAARLAPSGGADRPDGVSWVEVLTGRYLLDQPLPGADDPDDPVRPAPSRRGSGLPAREPWRPDDRLDARARRDPPDRWGPSDQRGGWEPDDRRGPRRPAGDRDQRGPQDPRGSPDPRERPDDLESAGRGPAERRDPRSERSHDQNGLRASHDRGEAPRPVRAGPPVPVAVPADQPRSSPTLADLADRLASIERRLASIEAALASHPGAQPPPTSQAQQLPLPQGQQQRQPAPQRQPPPPPRPQPGGPPPPPNRTHH